VTFCNPKILGFGRSQSQDLGWAKRAGIQDLRIAISISNVCCTQWSIC